MNRLKAIFAALLISLTLASCASYHAYHAAQAAAQSKDWDRAVEQYEKAIEIDPDNREYRLAYDRARLEASRMHFEKGKVLYSQATVARNVGDQLRLAQMAATELQLTVKLDTTNQFAAVEMSKAFQMIQDIQRAAAESVSIDEIKRRAQANITKAQPPELNPASNDPISLTFSRDTPIKDIYRALANAFGINVLFDQAVKDDRITIELRDVTAQAAIERVMQAGNHFYKILDEKTIIIVPDNPQARRDYEDLVIRTFYLSNGDAEQVTNVVRTMIEARNVFPLKALNAITIRDTAHRRQDHRGQRQGQGRGGGAGGARAARPEPHPRHRHGHLRVPHGRGRSPELRCHRGADRRRQGLHRGDARPDPAGGGQPECAPRKPQLHHPHRDLLAAQDLWQQRAPGESGAPHLRG